MWAWSKIMTQNQHIVQVYFHIHVDFSRKWNWTLNNFQNSHGGSGRFIKTLRNTTSFDPMGHWSMHPSVPFYTSNLPPLLSALTEKGLPFWNGEKEQTSSTF